MHVYVAKPRSQRVIISPGQRDVLLLRERDAVHVPIKAVIEPDWNQNAPVAEFSERFKVTMRAGDQMDDEA